MKESVTVEKFRELFKTRDNVAAEWKKTGKKVVGCISTYTPEEIVYAAEALPHGGYGLFCCNVSYGGLSRNAGGCGIL